VADNFCGLMCNEHFRIIRSARGFSEIAEFLDHDFKSSQRRDYQHTFYATPCSIKNVPLDIRS